MVTYSFSIVPLFPWKFSELYKKGQTEKRQCVTRFSTLLWQLSQIRGVFKTGLANLTEDRTFNDIKELLSPLVESEAVNIYVTDELEEGEFEAVVINATAEFGAV